MLCLSYHFYRYRSLKSVGTAELHPKGKSNAAIPSAGSGTLNAILPASPELLLCFGHA